MNKQVKQWERYSVESLARNEQLAGGRLFMSEFGLADLSRIRLLHAGLDTVKQLYSGKLRQSVLEEVERVYNDGFGECMELGGHLWLIGSGGASG